MGKMASKRIAFNCHPCLLTSEEYENLKAFWMTNWNITGTSASVKVWHRRWCG